jgi:hypothetical protein
MRENVSPPPLDMARVGGFPRQRLHQVIRDSYAVRLWNAKSDQGQVVFTMGGPSAGANVLIEELQSNGELPCGERLLVLCSDDIRFLLPEAQSLIAQGHYTLWPVYHESLMLLDSIIEDILDAPFRANLVWDTTLTSLKQALGAMQRFKAAGYTVHVRGILIDPWEALTRSSLRMLETKRVLDRNVLLKLHKKVNTDWQEYTRHPHLIDSYEFKGVMFGTEVYSDGGEGQRFVTIASSFAPVGPDALDQRLHAVARSILDENADSRASLFASYYPNHPALR